ncbi:MAG TPA: hypothetical protein VGY76_00425 [Solirubrobacteraceae bacterium]|nr:hypothetical protein [Solirubrobacteraceae bacterium]
MRIRITIAIGLALTVVAVGVALARKPLVRAGTDGTPLPTEVGATPAPTTVCQGEETVPAGTTAIRVSMLSLMGPRLKLLARSQGQVVTSGELGYGWTGSIVSIPVARVAGTHPHTTICVSLAKRRQLVNLRGANTKFAPAVMGGKQVLTGRMRFDYMHPNDKSWLALALPTARRIGLNIGGGAGIVLLPLLLLLSAAALSSWLLVRDLR